MAIFNIHCKDPWFSFIREGLKTVEGRQKTHTYKRLRIGDRINFINGQETFLTQITEIREYNSIEDYFADVTLEKALPGIETIAQGLDIYYQWTSEEKIKQYGFLGIFVKPL